MKLFILLLVALLFTVHVSNSQTCLWAEKISGTDNDEGRSIGNDSSGNVYVGGFFYNSTLVFNNGISLNNGGTKDSYLAKYNSRGTCQWAQRISGTNEEGINSIAVDRSGNIYVTGNFASPTTNFNNGISLTNTNNSNFDGFIAKYDTKGTCLWAQKISGDGDDRGYSIAVDGSGNVYATGYFTSPTLSFNNNQSLTNSGDRDVYLAKYNTSGICQWAQVISGTNSDYATSIAVDGSGNVYVAGNYLSKLLSFNSGISLANNGDWDIFITKYNTSGTCQWAEKIGGTGRDEAWGIAVDGSGNAYITGFFASGILNFNNGISLTISRGEDAYFAKYNTGGICQWAEIISGTDSDVTASITVNGAGDIYVAGGFYSTTLSFNNGISLNNNGDEDAFFTKYNTSGTCQWAENISGIGQDEVRGISVDSFGSVYVAGRFISPTLTFNNGISFNNYFPTFYDAFIAKYIISKPPTLTTNSPICEGDDLLLFVDSIPFANYNWYGPDGFKSNQQNPVIKQAKAKLYGKYYFYSSIGSSSSDTLSIDIVINTSLVSPGDSSLIFVGSAAKIDSFIKLTNSKEWDGGSIWLKNRFSVKQNFATTFRFRTRFGSNGPADEGSLPGADGLAFVMQNHNYPVLGDKGGSMGYTGITNSLAIEFDLFHNTWDPNGNHIAVQSMGSLPNIADHTKDGSCLGINDKITTMKQDSMYYAKIEYDWTTKTLSVYLDETGKWESPALTIPNIDLASHLLLEDGEYVYIGFTSGTGIAYQEHDLFDWTIPCKNQLVGVEDKELRTGYSDELIIFPNPACDNIFISRVGPIGRLPLQEILIYNMLGECVKKPSSSSFSTTPYENQGDELRVDVSGLQPGIYYCTVCTGINKIIKSFALVR